MRIIIVTISLIIAIVWLIKTLNNVLDEGDDLKGWDK